MIILTPSTGFYHYIPSAAIKMADYHKSSLEEVDFQKEAIDDVRGIEAHPAAAALAAATEAQKPRMFSRGMIRLWLIVGISPA